MMRLNQRGIAFIPLLIWASAILFTGTVAVKEKLITIDLSGNKPLVQKVDSTPTPSPSENPTPSPTYIPTPTPKKVQPVYTDPDPVITCTSSYPNCSGQSIKAKQSACSKITCCQIGDKWSVYPSSDTCSQDQKAYYANKYVPTNSGTTNTYTPPSNTNEITCNVIGYSQSRNVWTYILTPAECDSAKASPPPVQPLTPFNLTLFDCTIDGQDVGKMTSAECSQKSTEYWNAKREESNQAYSQQQAIRDYNSAVSACLSRMRALGITSSSYAQQCNNNPNLGL